MIEQRVERLKDEIRAFKSSMPIAGLLLNTYFYTKTSSANYADGVTAHYTIKFIPTKPADGLGLTQLYEYCEALSTDAYWSQFNPFYLAVSNGYYKDSNGSAVKDLSYTATGFGAYEVRATVSVFSTVPGSIQIIFS